LDKKTIEVDLEVLVPYIDWTFFRTWQLFGKYPAILSDDVCWRRSDFRFADAQEMLKLFIERKKLTAKGIYGIFQRIKLTMMILS
jgi:5-methyltetrahydrofolate--homocysteine methyltransferase